MYLTSFHDPRRDDGCRQGRADDYRRSFDGLVGTYQNLHGAYGPIEGRSYLAGRGIRCRSSNTTAFLPGEPTSIKKPSSSPSSRG